MKPVFRILSFLALLTALIGCGRSGPAARAVEERPLMPPVAEDGAFRAVCWNIEWFPGKKLAGVDEAQRSAHVADVAKVIGELRPDLLVAQEIANQEAWDGLLTSSAQENESPLVSAVVSRFSGRQQLAIASRLPVDAAWHEAWVRTGENDPPRGFSHAVARLPSERLLLTYCVHLKSNAGGEAAENQAKREESVRQLLAHIESEQPKHRAELAPAIIIAGDFNTDPDAPSGQFAQEQTIQMLLDAGFQSAFEGVGRSERVTWPSNGRFPDATFDYLFYKNLKVLNVQVPAAFDDCSDHRPLVVDMKE